HRLVYGLDAPEAPVADVVFRRAEELGEPRVGEARLLEGPETLRAERLEVGARECMLLPDDLLDVTEEPRIDGGEARHLGDAQPPAEGLTDVPEPLGVRHAETLPQVGIARRRARLEADPADLERAERLLERLLEGPADGHHLAHRFHLRAERVARLGEFLEGEARDLGHYVVDRRLEAGRRLARDVVPDLVERVADGELGGDLGD